ncbi:hypothetical protein PHLCEN_2v8640 [Hermanssonia centrifuga]|uniref:Pre-rRNA-processing protein IPI3 n=1 Tax=Hermanssonia centrifuga TaxID=98765 RepID=A0A2R6NT12_9APHY|nr:hypothetical protein PHLCEN_2v8640 [Hermanssonia centrifuga]
MQLQELVLCATAPSSSSVGPGVIALHDIQTGSILATYKQTSAGTHCTAITPTRNGLGGIMLASQPEKSIMNVYNFQKIASGIMYNAWDAHYREVNVLRFTQDSAALLSGSEDSSVSVWSMSKLLDNATQNDLPIPLFTLSDHTLPVTDIACGVGLFPKCRVLTASLDHSVKAWDLSSGTLLTTFQFPRPISSLAWDVTERVFFAASPDGAIHQVNLFKQSDDKLSRVMEAVGGAGSIGIIRITDEDQQAAKMRLISVGQPIESLSISLTSTLLIVGTTAGLIHIYDIASHQLLRTISTHKGFSITCLMTMLKPPDLIGHVSLTLNATNATDVRDTIPVKPVAPFQRMRDPKSREAHEVMLLLPPSNTSLGKQRQVQAFFSYSTEELLRDYSVFVQPTESGAQSTGASLQTRVVELETEVAKLREQLGKAKGINDTMWETMVQRLVSQGKANGKDDHDMDVGEDVSGNERRKKRGRS